MDLIRGSGKTTAYTEFYNNLFAPEDGMLQRDCEGILEGDRDLPDLPVEDHWYNAIRCPFSYAKTQKGKGERMVKSCRRYADAFLEELSRAPVCDPERKKERVLVFAFHLVEQGGPAVNQMKRMFGPETTRRLVMGHMYGVL